MFRALNCHNIAHLGQPKGLNVSGQAEWLGPLWGKTDSATSRWVAQADDQ